GANGRRVLDRAKAENAVQVRPGDGKGAREGARGEQQLAVAVAAVAGRDRLLVCVEPDDLRPEQKLDAVLRVELLRLHERVGPLGLAAQEALRERRPMVRKRLLLAQEGDAP